MDKLRHLLTTLLACKLNFFSCPYRKSYSPTKDKVKVNVSIHVQGVSNIKELDMEFDVRVRIKFKWFDPRLVDWQVDFKSSSCGSLLSLTVIKERSDDL